MYRISFVLYDERLGEQRPELALTLKISDREEAIAAVYRAFESAASSKDDER